MGPSPVAVTDVGREDMAKMALIEDDDCMSSEPFGQVSNGIKRGSGPSGLKLRLQSGDAAGAVARWF